MGKHHNIFGKDDDGNDILIICPLYDDCFCCKYILQEYHMNLWKKNTSINEGDYIYYLRFEYDLDGLGNDNLLHSLEEILTDTLLRTSPPNISFIQNNDFGIYGYYHPHNNNFLYSSLSFDIISTKPYPDDLVREVSYKVKNNFYLCECEFSFGSYGYRNHNKFSDFQKRMIERSLSILKTDDFTPLQMDRFYTIVSAGITQLKFDSDKIINTIVQERISINYH
jgi:hypothetical protein